jgi:hypothetical protein
MNKNLNRFEQAARLVAGSLLLLLSFAVFIHPVAKLLIILAGLWVLLEGIYGCCPLYAAMGTKKPGQHQPETLLWLMIAGAQAAIGYVWWHAGWVKVWGGDFVNSLPQTVAYYAANNPFWFVRNFLLNQVTTYYGLYGGLVELAQYFIGIGLMVYAYVLVTAKRETTRRAAYYLSAVGLACGAIMNGVFYFALGHIDPWISAGNVAMFWIQLVLIYGFVNLLLIKNGRK